MWDGLLEGDSGNSKEALLAGLCTQRGKTF